MGHAFQEWAVESLFNWFAACKYLRVHRGGRALTVARTLLYPHVEQKQKSDHFPTSAERRWALQQPFTAPLRAGAQAETLTAEAKEDL